MKALVPVKRVVDANVKVQVKSDGSGIDLANVKMAVNPFCEIAVEEALRLREKGVVDEVIAVCVGTRVCQEQLRNCLALGADRAILVEAPDSLQPITIAKVLKSVYERESPGLVIFGKQSIDGDNSQTGPMFAALTGLPQGTFASQVTVEDGKCEVVREVDGGLQTVRIGLPAVITTDLRLNEPRYASLPNIMKAKKKPMDVLTLEELGIEDREHIEILSVVPPPQRKAGIKVESVDELVDKLRNEAKVIS